MSYFEVQSSFDAIHFNAIEKVKASGTCNYINEYKVELSSQEYNEYFRVKSVDFDGQASFSAIIQKSTNESKTKVQIRNDELSISRAEKNATLEIFNIEGKVILHEIIQKEASIKIDLPKGIYFYRINEKTGKIALTN